jgi:hypothetical protein
MARASGTEIKLAMQAVDPRALLMGHYVIVDLRESLPEGQACPAGLGEPVTTWRDPSAGPDAWVALAPAGDHHRAIAIAATREQALQSAPLAVRGSAYCTKFERFTAAEGEEAPPPTLVIESQLGIDRFYAEQALAERIDAELRDQSNVETARVFAILSIGQDGRARLKGLEVAGERFDLDLF